MTRSPSPRRSPAKPAVEPLERRELLAADLTVSQMAEFLRFAVGRTATFTATVRNNGPDPAAGVRLANAVDLAHVELVSSSSSQGGSSTAGNVTTFDLGDLAAGAEATATVTVRGVAAGTPANAVEVTADAEDLFTPNNAHRLDFAVDLGQAALVFSEAAVRPGTAAVGEFQAYAFTVHNQGPDPAVNVRLTDRFNPGLVRFVSAASSQGTFAQSGDTVTFDLGDVPVGGAVTASVTVAGVAEGQHSNEANVTADNGGSAGSFLDAVVRNPPPPFVPPPRVVGPALGDFGVVDVTPLLTIRTTPPRRRGGLVAFKVTAVNSSSATISGNVSLVFDGLSRLVRVPPQVPRTRVHAPPRSPYFDLMFRGGDFPPGGRLAFSVHLSPARGLEGLTPARLRRIPFRVRVLAGVGPR
jgi:uncharacterized repeat protein (TIGR01451 family)